MTTTDHLTFNANWHERSFTKFIEECSGKNEGIITLNTCLAQALSSNNWEDDEDNDDVMHNIEKNWVKVTTTTSILVKSFMHIMSIMDNDEQVIATLFIL